MNQAEIAQWLIERERLYGGKQSGVRRRKVSPLDRRTKAELAKGGMQGGDRYLHHGYAPEYAAAFQHFGRSSRLVIVELGILRGTGLAVLCDYFPNARVIGLDVDLSHFAGHEAALRQLGAFRDNRPELYEFDELDPGAESRIANILGGHDQIDIMIDDALHDDDSILAAYGAFRQFVSDRCFYFIEDNSTVHAKIPGSRSIGRLTVVCP